jgi:hypothetical protein
VAASTLGIPAVADLVADTVAVGRRLGLAVDDPIVLKDSLNLLVWLRPAPVVARVQVRTGLVRRPEALADSLALARHLAEAGLPVSPPVGAAITAYGQHDEDAVEAWLPVVALWAAAWGLVGDVEGLGWGVDARRRLGWVEQRLDDGP